MTLHRVPRTHTSSFAISVAMATMSCDYLTNSNGLFINLMNRPFDHRPLCQ